MSLSLFGLISCTERDEVKIWVDRDLRDKLYSESENVLGPSGTLSLLKLLDEEYRAHMDEEPTKKHQAIIELLNVADLNEEKCPLFYTEYKILQQLLSANVKFPNIVNYLKHYKDAMFSLCQGFLLSKLKEDIQKLPDDTEKFLELLKQSMIESSQNSQLIDRLFQISDFQSLSKGILLFMEKTSGPLKPSTQDGEKGSASFSEEYDSLIVKPCNVIRKQIQYSMSEFSTLSHENHMLQLLDPFAKLWLQNFNVCMSIVGRGRAFSYALGEEIYKHSFIIKNKSIKTEDEKVENQSSTAPPSKQKSMWFRFKSRSGN